MPRFTPLRAVLLGELLLSIGCSRLHEPSPADAAPPGDAGTVADAGSTGDGGSAADAALPVTACAPVVHASPGEPCFCHGPIAIHGGALYRQSVGIEIHDLADPLAPVWVHTIEERAGSEGGLAVLDDHLLSVANFGPLYVYDLADPLAPRQVAELALEGPATGIAVSGGAAVLSLHRDSGAGALAVVDLADLERPVVTATIELPQRARRVQMNEERAFVLTYRPEAVVIDVDLASRELSIHEVDSAAPTAMVLDGEILYVLVSDGSLRAFDIAGGAFAPIGALSGLGEYPSALEVRDGRAIVGGYDALFVIDVRDVARMRVAGRTEPSPSGTWIISAGDAAWLSSGNGLTAVELACAD